MVKLVAVCGALLSCLAFAPASASAAPPQQPPHYAVSLVAENGSGCPAGTTSVSQPNTTQFTVHYNQYQVTAGDGALFNAFHENCDLHVNVSVPSGWTYGITEVDYHGFANLDAGAHGMLAADIYFSGTPGVVPAQHQVYGPYSSNYEFTDQAPIAWAPCNFTGTLNIDTSATVTAGSNPSFAELLTADSTGLGTPTGYQLAFEQC